MFLDKQKKAQQLSYKKDLQVVGALSNLFSESVVPFLYYRVSERVFCDSFSAEDLSRSDVSSDAKKSDLGIGIKTFLAGNNKTLQKVAEFNADSNTFNGLKPKELIMKIAMLRNQRIRFTESSFALNSSIYHCVVREKNLFKFHEEPMRYIDLESIQNVKKKNTTIQFEDKYSEYSFSLSKSTLLKRFDTSSCLDCVDIDILDDPLAMLRESALLHPGGSKLSKDVETAYLPLYTPGNTKGVPEKAQLNQWNAAGRKRDPDEIYVSVPAKFRKKMVGFFPEKDRSFTLIFPDGDEVDAKICQENGKALMTNPNKKIGKLILREGLNLAEGEIVTYSHLALLGIDSIRLDKINEFEYRVNFSGLGSYEKFIES